MSRIAFFNPQLDVRGSCDALFSYAHYNETLLRGSSVIVVPESGHSKSDAIAISRFSERFPVRWYPDGKEGLEKAVEDCEIFYAIKYGKNDGIYSERIKTVVHCVFDLSEPHGAVYAAVSETLARKYGKNLFVPHMISLPITNKESMRIDLGIPEKAVVFGRYGGQDTFNLDFAHRAIERVLETNPNVWFLFANTPYFTSPHPRVIHLPKMIDPEEKSRFVKTCDAHLECGSLGHTFGIAMGEFSVHNKPIIAFKGNVWNSAHYDILGDRGIYFRNGEELVDILNNFDPEVWKTKDNNCYKDYTPEKVMEQFERVFIRQAENETNGVLTN